MLAKGVEVGGDVEQNQILTIAPRESQNFDQLRTGPIAPFRKLSSKQKGLTNSGNSGASIFIGSPPNLSNVEAQSRTGYLQVCSNAFGVHGLESKRTTRAARKG